jgi:type II secretory pathway pseudopilin PulG
MKANFVAFAAVAIIAGFAGAGITNEMNSMRSSQQLSLAGQTLSDLSRAIEAERTRTGKYPDSIRELDVQGSHGDFSAEILKSVHYFRTDNGFVAFVGRPKVSFIYPGVSTQHK